MSAAATRRALLRLVTALERVLDLTLAAMVAAMVGIVIWQVFARYALHRAPGWSEELARYLLVWITTLGAAAVLRGGGHISVSWFVLRLRGRARAAVLALRDLAFAATLLLLVVNGFEYAEVNAAQESAAMEVPMNLVYLGLPLGAALTLVVLALSRLAGEVWLPAEADLL